MALSKELPEEVELCRTCGAGLVFHLPGGEKKQAYCPKCGAKEPGVLYVRKDVLRPRASPPGATNPAPVGESFSTFSSKCSASPFAAMRKDIRTQRSSTVGRLRRWHRWASVPAGVFIGLWILSGAALVWDAGRGFHAFPPHQRHGDVRGFKLQVSELLHELRGPVSRVTAFMVGGRHLYEVVTVNRTALYDGDSGRNLSPLDQSLDEELLSGYAGVRPLSVRAVTSRSYEYTYGDLPAWRGEFADGRIIHISAASGQPTSWTDRTGMVVRAAYYAQHALRLTGDPRWDTLIEAVAILVTALSLAAGIASYLPIRRKTG